MNIWQKYKILFKILSIIFIIGRIIIFCLGISGSQGVTKYGVYWVGIFFESGCVDFGIWIIYKIEINSKKS